jgi:hypothetical protein
MKPFPSFGGTAAKIKLDLRYIWVGLKDYLKALPAEEGPLQKRAHSQALSLPMRAVSGVLGVLVLALVAKAASPLMTLGNVDLFTTGVSWLFAAFALGVIVVLPLYVIRRCYRFVAQLHARGKAICEAEARAD